MNNSSEIKVNNKKIVVHQATYLAGLTRAALMSEASEDQPEEPKNLEEKLLRYTRTFLYPSLMACSTMKQKLTIDQFMELPDTDVDLWVKTAEKLNPHWFALEEETTSKKETKQTPST